ncbi:MAG: MTAP family purine nucleoside phosphorylase [Bdellovibrionales bacterium]|nr:MTAP family purine nucleoside phosphorylase [Bdellovibrionales bacterium]
METIGIIGGSGLYELPNFEMVKRHEIETPFGKPSAPIVELSFEGAPVFFLARHGEHHQYLPHELPFRANIYALKQLGVTSCLSISAVGSMKEEIAPGDFVFPDQLIDWTLRKNITFLENGLAGYPASADPFSDELSEELATVLAAHSKSKVHRGGSYICIEGPHLSTRAESAVYRSFGTSIIGMTACPEVRLAFEAQMKFSLIGMVSDYDCWHTEEEDVTVAIVLETLRTSTEIVKGALPSLIQKMRQVARTDSEKNQLRSALMIPEDKAPNPAVLKVLLS